MKKIFLAILLLYSVTGTASKRFYKFFDDGGEHPTNSCETVRKLPKKLKKEKDFFALQHYLGAEQTEFAEDNEAAIDAWEHYFSTSTACDKAAKKNYHCYETNGQDAECKGFFSVFSIDKKAK